MQGFNMGRYVPPDVEGTITSGNKLHKKHALGARASKLSSHGALTVRFEMPFAIWCATCPKPTIIGQGVRFNASKTRTGSYHSTPIYSFRMRHPACGGDIEIRTDPANTAYVVTEGARKRDTGEGKSDRVVLPGGYEVQADELAEGGVKVLTEKEREAARGSAFARLEKTIKDREQAKGARQRIDELADESARLWEDPYAQNRRLRDAFRVGRKTREGEAETTEELRYRMSLGIELVPGTAEDAQRAALVDFGPGEGAEGSWGAEALAKPLFGALGKEEKGKEKEMAKANGQKKTTSTSSKEKHGKKRLKSEIAASQMRESLVFEIVTNTRVAQDPFLSSDHRKGDTGVNMTRIPGIKRKRREIEEEASVIKGPGPAEEEWGKGAVASAALVEYDSD
ncbi:Uu.00g126360.m01.CDS01 [Anthostomella pinea]|uniref:Uu.00g126360.m01.CDS01 n=1 Tax=Anthostomella pinea TaxID=933095 RepID=A0AAI8VCN0_9PEZI|nr:Uu.00g126360.m01.CDS01 [Anthostomella pinea]